ncbi:MAG: hypothetical protein IJ043_09795 [Clostridia bacterium]|nr:hypothetical protein [Clostridia bacterium]
MKIKLIALLWILLLLLAGCKTPDSSPSAAAEAPLPQQTAEEEETPNVYCGNTLTTLQLCDEFGTPNGEEYTFMAGPSVTLTDLLRRLDYDPEKVCKCCSYSIAVTTEFGGPYYISFSESYARCKEGQADLTPEQLETIQTITADLQNGKFLY